MALASIDDAAVESYVRAALQLAGYHFDSVAVDRITAEFSRILVVAAPLFAFPVPLELEPLAQFHP